MLRVFCLELHPGPAQCSSSTKAHKNIWNRYYTLLDVSLEVMVQKYTLVSICICHLWIIYIYLCCQLIPPFGEKQFKIKN